MTAITTDQASPPASSRNPTDVRRVPAPIPTSRLLRVELAKMFDTRSGFWLLVAIAATATLATGAVVIFAPESALTYDTFGAAIGIPMTVLLPVMAILSVTSEWSQRSGLTTFTLVPQRGRVITAKAVAALGVGVISILVALAIGAVGNLVGSSIAGVDPVWDISATQVATLLLANVINLMIGFMLAVLIRNSPAAIVGYVVYSFVLPPLSMLLASTQDWWRDKQPWLDLNIAQGPLFDGDLAGADWAHLATSGLIWLVVPLVVGLVTVLRSEVK